jgi:hypothetical protein
VARGKSAAQHHPTDHCYQYEPKRRIDSHDFLNVIFHGRPCWLNSQPGESSHAEMSRGPADTRRGTALPMAALSTNMVNAAIAAGACARTMPESPKYQRAAFTADIRERCRGALVRACGLTT